MCVFHRTGSTPSRKVKYSIPPPSEKRKTQAGLSLSIGAGYTYACVYILVPLCPKKFFGRRHPRHSSGSERERENIYIDNDDDDYVLGFFCFIQEVHLIIHSENRTCLTGTCGGNAYMQPTENWQSCPIEDSWTAGLSGLICLLERLTRAIQIETRSVIVLVI